MPFGPFGVKLFVEPSELTRDLGNTGTSGHRPSHILHKSLDIARMLVHNSFQRCLTVDRSGLWEGVKINVLQGYSQTYTKAESQGAIVSTSRDGCQRNLRLSIESAEKYPILVVVGSLSIYPGI